MNSQKLAALRHRSAIKKQQEQGRQPPQVTVPAALPITDCKYFGKDTGKRVKCVEGGCKSKLFVFECDKFGECTVARFGEGVEHKCKGCFSREVGVRQTQQVRELPTMRTENWAYGVTSCAERINTLLPQTLRSLATAGFDRPRLFIDGIGHEEAGRVEKKFGLEVTAHDKPLKTVGNWVTALWELLVRNPTINRFALFQDDLLTCRDLRQYLDNSKWPEKGYLNLYTFPLNQAVAPSAGRGEAGACSGWFEAKECANGPLYHGKMGQKGLGAVALCFTRDAVIDILSARRTAMRPLDAVWPTSKLDGLIVTAMNDAGWREYCHDPSLVQHTGERSSMGNNKHPLATSFKGEQWSALELLRG